MPPSPGGVAMAAMVSDSRSIVPAGAPNDLGLQDRQVGYALPESNGRILAFHRGESGRLIRAEPVPEYLIPWNVECLAGRALGDSELVRANPVRAIAPPEPQRGRVDQAGRDDERRHAASLR